MSSSLISSRSISGSTSSSLSAVKCSGPMVARSEPEPLTHMTGISRPVWSVAVPLADVLPPPKFETARLAPSRCEASTSWSSTVIGRLVVGPEVVDAVDQWRDGAHVVISWGSRSVAMRWA